MGSNALTDDQYLPDFSAKVMGKAKILRIAREDYRKALSPVIRH